MFTLTWFLAKHIVQNANLVNHVIKKKRFNSANEIVQIVNLSQNLDLYFKRQSCLLRPLVQLEQLILKQKWSYHACGKMEACFTLTKYK